VDANGFITQGTIAVVTQPKVTKSATGFTVSTGTWSPSASDTTTVTWTVYPKTGGSSTFNQAALPIADDPSGSYITVSVEHQLAGYVETTTPDIVAQAGSAPVPSVGLTITGTPQVGVTLNAPAPTWTPTGGTSSYQWQYKSGSTWKNLAGGVTSSYTPLATDLGRLLRVITTRHPIGFAIATLIATAPSVVGIGAAPVNSPAISVIGTAGTNLTVTPRTEPRRLQR
jgi:hypothetical protein